MDAATIQSITLVAHRHNQPKTNKQKNNKITEKARARNSTSKFHRHKHSTIKI